MNVEEPIMKISWSAVQGIDATKIQYYLDQKEELLAGSLDIDETMTDWVLIHPDHLDLFRIVPPDIVVIIRLQGGRLDSNLDNLILHARNHKSLRFADVSSISGIEFLDSLQWLWLDTNEAVDLSPLQMMDSLRSLTLSGLNCKELDLSHLSSRVHVVITGIQGGSQVNTLKLSTRTPSVHNIGTEIDTIVVVEDSPGLSSPVVLPHFETHTRTLFRLVSSIPGVPVVIDRLVFTPYCNHLGQLTKKEVHARQIRINIMRNMPDFFTLKGITTEHLHSLTIVSRTRNRTIGGFEFLETASQLSTVKMSARDDVNIRNFSAWGESRGFVLMDVEAGYRSLCVFVRTIQHNSGDVEPSQ